jgi:hypothetical protein
MSLSPEQYAVLKADILASPDMNTLPLTSTGTAAIQKLYNAAAVPAFQVTKTSLSRHDILTGTSGEGTTFSWAGGAYITRSQGERDAFREMFNSTGTVNPTLASITAAFSDIFSGAGGLGNRTHITAMSKRVATRFERLFATGTGTLISPGTLVLEGNVSNDNLQIAMEL